MMIEPYLLVEFCNFSILSGSMDFAKMLIIIPLFFGTLPRLFNIDREKVKRDAKTFSLPVLYKTLSGDFILRHTE